MQAPYSSRRDKLRTALRAQGGPRPLLVTSSTNVTYLTGFTGDSSVLILTPTTELIVSDGRYSLQIQEECPGLDAHIRPVGQPLFAGVRAALQSLQPREVSFEAAHLSVAELERLRDAMPSVEWHPTIGLTETLRMIKDDDEIARIRQAIEIAKAAFQLAQTRLAESDIDEKSLADFLEFEMRKAGSTTAPFPPIVAFGPNAALPHYRPSPTTRLSPTTAALIDWGATWAGYRSDLTRTLPPRTPSQQFNEVYDAVREAQMRAIAEIRPGKTAREIDRAARGLLEKRGFGAAFTHGLGHGLGLDIHELPFLGRDPDLTLQAGMTLTIEPGVYLPGWGGVRIEDDVLVHPDGCEVLSRAALDLAPPACTKPTTA